MANLASIPTEMVGFFMQNFRRAETEVKARL